MIFLDFHPLERNTYFCLLCVQPQVMRLLYHKLYVNTGVKYTTTLNIMLVENKYTVSSLAHVYEILWKDCELIYIGETS